MALLAALLSTTIDLIACALHCRSVNGVMTADRPASQDARRRPGIAPVTLVACALLMGLGVLQVMHDAATELLGFLLHGAEPVGRAPLRFAPLDGWLLLSAVLLAATLQAGAMLTQEATLPASGCASHALAQGGLALVASAATQLRASWWLFDPVGALFCSILCVLPWATQAVKQVQLLVDRRADVHVGPVIRAITRKHGVALDALRVYRSGSKLFVSLDVALPQETVLRRSRDAADGLQREIEALATVERCFVQIGPPHRHNGAHNPSACDLEREQPVDELFMSDSQLFSSLVFKLRELSDGEED